MDISSFPKFVISGTICPKNMAFMDAETTSASDVAAFLEANKEAKTVVIEVRSPGGFVNEGFQIHDLLTSSGKEVITIGYRVSSIAVVCFLAGDKRYVTENVEFVIHNARFDPMLLGMEPLTADDLSALAAEAEKTDNKIINLYCSVLGEDNRAALMALMEADTDLGSKGALKYKFANGLYKTKTDKDEKKKGKIKNLCLEECLTNLIKNNFEEMENKKVDELSSKIDKIFNSVKTLFRLSVKNDVTLEAGDKKIIVITDSEEIKDKKAVLADEAGLPTEDLAPEGEHTLNDGRVIVVNAEGIITEVKEAVDVEALKKEIEDKNAEITNLKSKVTQLEAAGVESLNMVKDLKAEFEKFKNEVPGDPDKNPQPKKPVELQNMSVQQRLKAMSIEKFKTK